MRPARRVRAGTGVAARLKPCSRGGSSAPGVGAHDQNARRRLARRRLAMESPAISPRSRPALCLPSPQTLAFVGEMPVTQHADQTVWRVGPRDCVPVPRRLHVPPTPDPSAARGRAPDLADVRAEPVTAATIDCTRTCAAAVPGAVLVLGALRGGLASPSLLACAYSASCRAGSRS